MKLRITKKDAAIHQTLRGLRYVLTKRGDELEINFQDNLKVHQWQTIKSKIQALFPDFDIEEVEEETWTSAS